MASRACNPSSISLFAASLLLSLALLVFAIAGGLHCFVTKTPDDEEGFASRLQTVTLLALLTIVLDWLLAYPLGYGVVLWTPSGWPVLGHLFAPLLLNRVVYFAIAPLWHAALAMTASGVPALRLPDASEASDRGTPFRRFLPVVVALAFTTFGSASASASALASTSASASASA